MRVMHRVLPVGIEDLAHRHHLGRVRDVVAQEGALHAEAVRWGLKGGKGCGRNRRRGHSVPAASRTSTRACPASLV